MDALKGEGKRLTSLHLAAELGRSTTMITLVNFIMKAGEFWSYGHSKGKGREGGREGARG